MIAIVLAVCLMGGVLAALIAANRGVAQPGVFFFIGAILPLIGVVLACVAQPGAPRGMVKVKCPRCDAKTNVAHDAPEMECWRCHLVQGHPEKMSG